MSKQILVISKLHLSNKTKGIQSQLEGLEVGESIVADNKKYIKVTQDTCDVEYSSDWHEYEFGDSTIVGSFRKKIDVSANNVETVMVNCMEGGSTYWMGLDNSTDVWEGKPQGIPLSTWATQMLLDGKTLHFYDLEDEDEKWTLTLEKLIEGFKLNAENRPHDCDLENGDATTSDCIIQYAMMGEIVYG